MTVTEQELTGVVIHITKDQREAMDRISNKSGYCSKKAMLREALRKFIKENDK